MIPLLIIIFIFNIFAIIGFYHATDYEHDSNILKIKLEIRKGFIDQISAHENGSRTRYTASGEYKTLMAASDKLLPTFEPSQDFEGAISDIELIENIGEESKQVLWFIRYYAKKWLGDYWCKPIACCNICMSSVHSFWYWLILLAYPFHWWMIPLFLFYMVSMVGVQKLISEKFDL